MNRFLPSVLVATAIAACGGETTNASLFVDVQSDLVPGIEFIGIDAEVFSELGALQGDRSISKKAAHALGNATLPLRAAEFDGLAPGSKALRVRLITATGETRLERIALVDVTGNTTATLVMTRECEGVTCPGSGDDASALACLGGRCVDPRCTPESPEFCPPPDCQSPGDCAAVASCAEARCDFGVCFPTVRALSCPAGTWCNPETGCLPASTDRCLAQQ